MATSNSYNYTRTPNQIIERALRICQIIGEGESPSTYVLSDHRDLLNDIIKSWHSDGMTLFTIDDGAFTLTASKRTYKLGADQVSPEFTVQYPLRIIQAYLRNNTDATNPIDTPLLIYTREEYNMLSNKSVEGTPTAIMYEPVLGKNWQTENYGTVKVYPVPNSTIASNYQLVLVYSRPHMDLDSGTENIEFPAEWYRALCWALADDLSYMYGLPYAERSMIHKKALELHQYALMNTSQEGSMYLQPEANW